MTHLSDDELRTEHLAGIAIGLNRLDLSDEAHALRLMARLSELSPDDLVDVMAASKEFAMLMLKLAVGLT